MGGTGGDGGDGGTNTAGAGTGGNGAAGTGGNATVSAGTFDMSNSMSNMGQSAAGIMSVVQNNGFSSLIQQSVNVQSNLTLGR